MTYAQALAVLDERQETRVELGLDRVRAHLARLGSPEKGLKVIHVAGTNGKGSTCALLEAALRAAKYKTGLYTSPHLHSPLERIQAAGRPISEDEFARVMKAVLSVETEKLTYFELLTAAAFVHFAHEQCEAVVLEVGLGGRLDATNVVEKPLACVITSIGFDHMDWLGNTLGKIAAEKAGIAKEGVPLIVPALARTAMASIRSAAKRVNAPLRVIPRPWPRTTVRWTRGEQGFTAPFGAVNVGLLGERQGMNAALAHHALKAAGRDLPVADSAVRRGFQRVKWPLRFQIVKQGRRTAILDGAHNAEAMAHFAKTFKNSPFARRNPLFIVGVLKDKDAKAIVKRLAPLVRKVVAVAPPSPRALAAADLAKLLKRAAPRAEIEKSTVSAAIGDWKRLPDAPRTAVVCGSFYLAADAARLLGTTHA